MNEFLTHFPLKFIIFLFCFTLFEGICLFVVDHEDKMRNKLGKMKNKLKRYCHFW